LSEKDDGDLSDLLQELRVLLPGAQTLTAFLIILPFNGGFAQIRDEEKAVYLITFLCSVISLVLFTAPAAHHRLQRPLRDREGFKTLATKLIIAGLVPLSIALILATQLVISEVVPVRWFSWAVSALLAVFIVILWWIIPKHRRDRLTGL
jgi:CBS domain containing-hemolysin-like protein